MTFALSNTDVLYCQGMSDLAARLLVVTEDESVAYFLCKSQKKFLRFF